MRILTVGDVVGTSGTEAAVENLAKIKEKFQIDFCIVNGENSCSANGISEETAEKLLAAGADVITLGNHTFRQKHAKALLANSENVIRPINYPKGTVGRGAAVFEKNGVRIGVLNALGRVYLDPVDCPFQTLKAAIKEMDADIKIVDFHAEATSEKRSMGFYLDGKVSVVFGTHTHVQTSDIQILPRGTGYITDIGMTGPHQSCLGVDKSIVIDRLANGILNKFELSSSPARIDGAIFTVDEKSGKCLSGEIFSILPGEPI